MKKVMLVFGTRPEAIKMCPLVNELKTRENIDTKVLVTGQHRQMLDQVLDAFGVVPDFDLSIMKSKQTLFDITTNILNRIKELQPQAVIFLQSVFHVTREKSDTEEFINNLPFKPPIFYFITIYKTKKD